MITRDKGGPTEVMYGRVTKGTTEKFAEGVVASKWVIKARRQAKRSSR